MGGDTEVEKDSVHRIVLIAAEFFEDTPEVAKRRGHRAQAIAETGKSGSGRAARFGVEIEADQNPVGRGPLENGFGVTAAAEGAIDDPGTCTEIEVVEDFVEENRAVFECCHHESQLPPACTGVERVEILVVRGAGGPGPPMYRRVPPSNHVDPQLVSQDTPASLQEEILFLSPTRSF